MNGLNRLIEKIKPTFSKGGKLGFLHSTFEAFESFLFVPGTVTAGKGTHVKDAVDLKRIMIIVVIALVPSLLFGIYYCLLISHLKLQTRNIFIFALIIHNAVSMIQRNIINFLLGSLQLVVQRIFCRYFCMI